MKILVLAGGADQAALIEELKTRGHEVLLLDYLSNPPAKSHVKLHIQESTLDIEKVKFHATREKVDLICTACTDQALLTVAKVSEELHLPCYISYKTALDVTNKHYMKTRMVETGIPTARFVTIKSKDDISGIEGLEYPLVVKPADCNSSKGVIKVNCREECEMRLLEAIEMSRSSTAIAEEFKNGEEISADFYIDGKQPILLSATSSSKIKGTSGFTITGSIYPAISAEEGRRLIEIANRITENFNLKDTPLLIQLIRSDRNFYVIEFSARMGGGSKYRLIQEISGVNIMARYTDLILGLKPKVVPELTNSCIRMLYVYTYPGKVSAVNGLEYLIEENIIKTVFRYKETGCEITKAETSSDRILGILVIAESNDEMMRKIDYINSMISVIDENGEDIMMHDIFGR